MNKEQIIEYAVIDACQAVRRLREIVEADMESARKHSLLIKDAGEELLALAAAMERKKAA